MKTYPLAAAIQELDAVCMACSNRIVKILVREFPKSLWKSVERKGDLWVEHECPDHRQGRAAA